MSACEILEEQPQIMAIFSSTEAAHTLVRACLPLRARRNHTVSSQPARKEFNPCCPTAVSPSQLHLSMDPDVLPQNKVEKGLHGHFGSCKVKGDLGEGVFTPWTL